MGFRGVDGFGRVIHGRVPLCCVTRGRHDPGLEMWAAQ